MAETGTGTVIGTGAVRGEARETATAAVRETVDETVGTAAEAIRIEGVTAGVTEAAAIGTDQTDSTLLCAIHTFCSF